jgi:hypothetical protein
MLILAGSAGAYAQNTEASTAACGTETMARVDRATLLENTRRANPALYDRIMSRREGGRLLSSASDGIEWTFLVQNRKTNTLDEIQATLVYDGLFSRVWVDNADTGKATLKPTSSTMRTLFKALDTAVVQTNLPPRDASKGILQNDIEVFGQIPQTYAVENKTDFLLLDIQDAVAGQYVLGYFSPTDQTETSESNRMNLLYIDSKEGFQQMQMLLGTIAHEFQHLIHYGRHNRDGDAVKRDVALNEGLSEQASVLNGYRPRSTAQYLRNTNLDFFGWHYTDATLQELDYERATLFAHYLSEHYGEHFLYELVGSQEENMARVTDALHKIGLPESFDFREVLKGYAVANYLQTSSNPSFNYTTKLGGSVRPHESYSGAGFPTSGTASLQSYGTYYVQYTDPGPMRFRYGGSSEVRAMLIGIRNADTTVTELEQNIDYDLPLWAGGVYRRATIAFVSTASAGREISWTAGALTSGAELESATAGRMAIDRAEADASGAATIAFAIPSSRAVRLELYSVRGDRVATLLDGVMLAAGRHEETFDTGALANGSYIVRLVADGRTATSMLFVVR